MSVTTGPRPSTLFNQYSFEFDGIDDYVTMGNVLNFDITDTFSFSSWVKFDALGTDEIIISKWSSASSFKGYALYKSASDKLIVYLRESNITFNLFVSTNTLSSGVWYNIIFTYDGSRLNTGMNLYLNGAIQSGSRSGNFYTGSMITTLPFNIGARNNGDLPLNGNIDETAIFNSELSASDVTSIYNSGVPNNLNDLSTPPLSWWRMGEAATFDGSRDWDLVDQGTGGNDAVTQNIADTERVTDVPS